MSTPKTDVQAYQAMECGHPHVTREVVSAEFARGMERLHAERVDRLMKYLRGKLATLEAAKEQAETNAVQFIKHTGAKDILDDMLIAVEELFHDSNS